MNQPNKQDFNLFVFQHLKAGLNPSKISQQFNVSLPRISYHLSSLIKQGFIKKMGYGTYEILKEYSKQVKKRTTRIHTNNPTTSKNNFNLFKPDSVRAHAFQFTLSINPNLRNWDKRAELLQQAGIKFKPLKLYGGAQSLQFKGRKVWLTRKSIIIFEKSSYMAENSTEARKYAVYDFLAFVGALERYLRADFGATRQDRLKFKVSRQHYALIKNALAKQYDSEGKKLEVSNEKGQWFIIDNSFNLHEAETIHPETADKDNLKVQAFFNGIKKFEGFTPEFVVNSLGGVMQTQELFAKNIESHVSAIQELAVGVKKLTQKIEELDNRKVFK
jgi:DNA-binding transcriptional ArsR family regulator